MKVKRAGVIAALVLGLAGFAGHVRAEEATVVDFLDTSEMASIGLVPYANARPLVPEQYTPIQVGENAHLVVRVAHSGSIRINGAPAGGATVAQVGISILPPEGDGDVNIYSLYYDTDNQALAKALRRAGVNARYVPHIGYAVSPGGDALTIDVPTPSRARYEVAGTITPPAGPAGAFTAIWWVDSDDAGTAIKMSTTVPSIGFGSAQMTLTADHNSPLRALIGGDTLAFPIFDAFNTFPSGRMVVEER